jgi:hypothetical protein
MIGIQNSNANRLRKYGNWKDSTPPGESLILRGPDKAIQAIGNIS